MSVRRTVPGELDDLVDYIRLRASRGARAADELEVPHSMKAGALTVDDGDLYDSTQP